MNVGTDNSISDFLPIVPPSPRLLEKYKLFLRFDDGVSGVVDLSDWKRDGVFEQVRITKLGALEWRGELNLCADALYLKLTGKQPEEIFPTLGKRVTHA